MSQAAYQSFSKTVWDYYHSHGRHDLPWRLPGADGTFNPYDILVSEIMLQQTQVLRVVPKYESFMRRFPDVDALDLSTLGDVLIAWQGLGYNRRAKFLWESAHVLKNKFGGVLPHTLAELDGLPGVGINTAGAVMAYAFDEPVVFVETNIRTVFIHHFFPGQHNVSDASIRQLVEATLPRSLSIRLWYWALMDYGTFLKQSAGNVARASSLYVRQSTFAGSVRQIRGRVMRLLSQSALPIERLLYELHDDRAERVVQDLAAEGLIRLRDGVYELP